MRIGLINDIHGNLKVLQSALAALSSQQTDSIICLGDIVEGAGDNTACIECLRAQNIQCVKGNHDEINDLRLRNEDREWLRALPENLTVQNVFLTHISPRPQMMKITDAIEAWNCFDDCEFDVAIVAHVHIPHIFRYPRRGALSAIEISFEYSQPVDLDADYRHLIINPPLNYPRDQYPKPRYSILDLDARTICFYDCAGPISRIEEIITWFNGELY